MEENIVTQTPKPNPLTTVTPLSKTLALILFIALPFLGFYLGMRYQKLVTFQSAATNTVKASPPNALPLNTTRIIKNSDRLREISFSYPDRWYLSESTSSGHPNLGTLHLHPTYSGDENLCIKITVSSESPGSTLDDELRNGATGYDASKKDYSDTSAKNLVTSNGYQAKVRGVKNNGSSFEDAAILLGTDKISTDRPIFAYLNSCTMTESGEFHDVLMSFSVR